MGVFVTHFRRKSLMEARVGIGQFTPLLHSKYTRFHSLFNIIRHNPTIPVLTPLVSVLVSATANEPSVRIRQSKKHYYPCRQIRLPPDCHLEILVEMRCASAMQYLCCNVLVSVVFP